MGLDTLAAKATVADIVMCRWKPICGARQVSGHMPVNGLGMLVHQAAHAFDLWFGHIRFLIRIARSPARDLGEHDVFDRFDGLDRHGQNPTAALFEEEACRAMTPMPPCMAL